MTRSLILKGSPALLVLGTMGVCAQTGSVPGGTSFAAGLYGGGQQSRLQLAGRQPSSNIVQLGLGQETGYDDNVAGSVGAKQGDLISNLGAHAILAYEGPRLGAALDYEPSMQLYGRFTAHDRFDQQFDATVAAALSDRWFIRGREVVSDQRSAGPSDGFVGASGNGSSTALNGSVVEPFVPEFGTSTRVDLGFVKDSRANLALFGAYERRSFTGAASDEQGLLDTRGITAGVQGVWRATEHGQVEVLLSGQRLSTVPISAGGISSTLPIESAFGSLSWRLGPDVTISGFGGPQYLGQQGTSTVTSVPEPWSKRVAWAGGGVLTRQARQSSWFVSGQRMVSDGGGLLSYVMSASLSAGVHRLILPGWDGTLQFDLGRNTGLGAAEAGSSIANAGVSCMLQRSVGNLTSHISYLYVWQQETGSVLPGSITRNQVGFGLSYQLKTIALGR